MDIRNKQSLIILITMASCFIALAIMSSEERYIAAPVFVCTMLMIWFWFELWKRDGAIPFFDIGVLCALATFTYTVFPLLNFWVNGLQFSFLSDFRLINHDPSPAEIGLFHLRHVLYLFSLVFSYVYFRRNGTIQKIQINSLSRSDQKVILLYFVLLTVYFVLLELMTGFSFNVSYASEAYDSFLETTANMPLLMLQLSSKLWGIRFVFKLALLFIVISKCTQKRWRIVLFSWIFAEIIHTFLIKGARTELVLFIMASALLYHRLVKPLTIKFLIISGSLLLTGFLFLGLYRIYINFADMQANLIQSDIGLFSAGNEFQSLLGTSYDVYLLKDSGVKLPWYLYINDFITILPPQQILPFTKVRASEWYLRQIGLSGTGIGLMWGVITQSIVGLDWPELALRGVILGYLLARLHRWYIKNQTGFFETLVYMYFCLRVYYTFRDTTFSPLSNFVWEVIPFYILLNVRIVFYSCKNNKKLPNNDVISPPKLKEN